MNDRPIGTEPLAKPATDGWQRIASHGIAKGCWRIAKASVCGETIYTLFEMVKQIQSRDLVTWPVIRGTSRDLDELKRAADAFEAKRPKAPAQEGKTA